MRPLRPAICIATLRAKSPRSVNRTAAPPVMNANASTTTNSSASLAATPLRTPMAHVPPVHRRTRQHRPDTPRTTLATPTPARHHGQQRRPHLHVRRVSSLSCPSATNDSKPSEPSAIGSGNGQAAEKIGTIATARSWPAPAEPTREPRTPGTTTTASASAAHCARVADKEQRAGACAPAHRAVDRTRQSYYV